MIRLNQARLRKGFTLTEVLMAMFVMAIGMISLLALFPAAFQQAKWALDNEQVARAAGNAQSMTEMAHMPVVQLPVAGSLPIVGTTTQSVRDDDNYNPNSSNTNMQWKLLGYAATTTGSVASDLSARLGRSTFLVHYDIVTDPTKPAYRWTYNTNINVPGVPAGARVKFPPVFVDPLDSQNFFYTFAPGVALPFHVGSDNTLNVPFRFNSGVGNVSAAVSRPNRSIGIPRLTMSQYQNDNDPLGIRKQLELKMSDEITFGANGQPMDGNSKQYPDPTATAFARQSRFTWAYMCQWPDYATSEICEVTAVVFNSRAEFNGLTQFPLGETTYTAPLDTLMFTKGLTQALIPLGSPQPMNARVGDWILDSTFILPGYDPANPLVTAPFLDTYSILPINGLLPGLVGGHFYKILDISSVQVSAGVYFQTITLDRPARSDGFTGTLMTGIADVITKSTGRMPQR